MSRNERRDGERREKDRKREKMRERESGKNTHTHTYTHKHLKRKDLAVDLDLAGPGLASPHTYYECVPEQTSITREYPLSAHHSDTGPVNQVLFPPRGGMRHD